MLIHFSAMDSRIDDKDLNDIEFYALPTSLNVNSSEIEKIETNNGVTVFVLKNIGVFGSSSHVLFVNLFNYFKSSLQDSFPKNKKDHGTYKIQFVYKKNFYKYCFVVKNGEVVEKYLSKNDNMIFHFIKTETETFYGKDVINNVINTKINESDFFEWFLEKTVVKVDKDLNFIISIEETQEIKLYTGNYDENILNEMEREEIWFVSKDAKNLKPLTDYVVPEEADVLKAYKNGRFLC